MRILTLLVFLAILSAVACTAFHREPTPPPETQSSKHETTQGVLLKASYYGKQDGFSGRRTANGDIFNPNALTAAHRTYPFGTRLRVTNPENMKSVVVTVNDRGPFAKKQGPDLDLSYRAAHELGLTDDGVAPVRVSVVSDEEAQEK